MRQVHLARALAAMMSLAGSAEAALRAEDPSDHVRILEAGEPREWNEAVEGLLGENGKLPIHAVASVVRRIPFLTPEIRERVARALRWHGHTLETLWWLAHEDEDERVREAAMASLLESGAPGLMDACQVLIEAESPYRMEALAALVDAFDHWSGALEEGTAPVVFDPVLSPENGTPEEIFDQRYLHAVSLLLLAEEPDVRSAALRETSSIDTPGLRRLWLELTNDSEVSIRWDALWTLADKSDPAACRILFEELGEEDDVKRAGAACAPAFYLEYFRRYAAGQEPARYEAMIESATRPERLDEAGVVAGVSAYGDHDDAFLRETARTVLGWHREAREAKAPPPAMGVRPAALMVSAFVSFVLGVMLFVWAFRLYGLFVRVRNRPMSKIATMPMGPVALEGNVQPAGGPLRHPLTEEPCVYYAGADIDHPDARFYLIDDSGRVLVDPRRAVLFSDDGVLVAGERVHLVGHADRDLGKVVIGKDRSSPPLYRRIGHRIIETLFGFGQKTSVTKMLFTDPARCFWIWDDLERRPMGESRDVLWLAASVLLAGAWIVVFAVAILGLVDQEVSASLARALDMS